MNHAKRLGIFGGSFDPPHIAHLALAKHAIAQFHLNELRIIPTGDAWHKTRTLTASPHRLAMTRLAFAEVPQAVVDPREIDREGATYTIDTLRDLRAANPDADLFFITGTDAISSIGTWKDVDSLWQLAHWPVTGNWVWFHLVGFQSVVAWQLMQLAAATGMWAAGLPEAALPLWQLAQLVAAVKPLSPRSTR